MNLLCCSKKKMEKNCLSGFDIPIIGQKVPSHSHHVVDNIPQAPKDFPPIRLRLNVANEGSFTSSFVTAPIHAFAKSLSPIILPLFLSLLAFGLLIFLTRVATALPASS